MRPAPQAIGEQTVDGPRDPKEAEEKTAAGAKKAAPPDPLGTGAKPGDLSEKDKGRVRMAALNYVRAVYDAAPSSKISDYQDKVNDAVVTPDFYKSAGAKTVAAFSEKIYEGGGASSESDPGGFTVEEADGDTITGVVAFKLKDDSSPALVGTGAYQERVRLTRWGAVFKVLGSEGAVAQGAS